MHKIRLSRSGWAFRVKWIPTPPWESVEGKTEGLWYKTVGRATVQEHRCHVLFVFTVLTVLTVSTVYVFTVFTVPSVFAVPIALFVTAFNYCIGSFYSSFPRPAPVDPYRVLPRAFRGRLG